MDTKELQKLVEEHPKNASGIAEDIGVSRSAMSKWLNGKRGIGEVEAKLLRLYFYGEIPFDMLRPEADLQSLLVFTASEWQVISLLAKRDGFESSKAWIVAQIRAHLRP